MDTNLSKQMQNDILLTVCTKKLLLKLIVFTTHRGYKCCSNKYRTILYSRCLRKISIKTKLVSLLTVDTKVSKQDDSLLTAGIKKLLLKLSIFYYSRRIHFFLNKCRTILYSRLVPKICVKTELFLVFTVDAKIF